MMELTLNILRKVPIFTGVSDDGLKLFYTKSKQQDVAAGSVVVREGESNNRLYIILSGSVRVCKSLGAEDETELATLSEGEFFGEMCILDTLPRSASVLAITDVTIISLSSLVFWELHEAKPGEYGVVLLNIARDLSRRLRHIDESLCARNKHTPDSSK